MCRWLRRCSRSIRRRAFRWSRLANNMSDFILKYADTRGEVHSQMAQGTSAQEVRERYTNQGFLVYSVKPKTTGLSLSGDIALPGRRKRLNLEKFLIDRKSTRLNSSHLGI